MGHYAKVVNSKVVKVIVAEQEYMDTFVDNSPGRWLQASYNTHNGVHSLGGTPLRQNYPGIDWNYDGVADVFYAPQPYDSWNLNTTKWQWEPPVAYPSDGADGIKKYKWEEANQRWVEI